MTQVIQNALTMLRAGEWMPVTAARVLIGIFFCISGGTKLFVPAQFRVLEQTIVQSHIPFPHATALFVSTVEFACGAGLALGFLAPLCAAAQAVALDRRGQAGKSRELFAAVAKVAPASAAL